MREYKSRFVPHFIESTMTKLQLLLTTIVIVVLGALFSFKQTPLTKQPQPNIQKNERSDSTETKMEWMMLYDSLQLKEKGLSLQAFHTAWYGFMKMNLQNPIMAIADFSQSSRNKRLYVIDMMHKKILMHTYVAHGRNSGEEFAHKFSNINSSYQSSLGFYRTLGTYMGKHGLSLKLEGVEKGINDRAFERAIVMHGAEYVSENFIKNTGRLGRSQGCPAVSIADSKKLINLLYQGAGLFIYSLDQKYLRNSRLLAGLTPQADIRSRQEYSMGK